MLSITLQGVNIPIPTDFSMQLTWKSPMCDFEKIPSGYGLGLSFPINEYTRMIFGNPERFSKRRISNDQKFSGCEVRFGGILLMAGTLKINSASDGNYDATLSDQVGSLGEQEQERYINDFTVFDKLTPWSNSGNFRQSTHDYCCFELSNPYFFKDRGRVVELDEPLREETIPGLPDDLPDSTEVLTYCFERTSHCCVNMLSKANNTVMMYTSPINITYEHWKDGLLSVISPFLFLNKILEKSLKEVSFHIIENAFDDSDDLKSLCIYNNFDITRNRPTLVDTGVVGWKDSLIFVRDGVTPISGQWVTTKVKYAIKQEGYNRFYESGVKTKYLLPRIKLGDLILSTQNLLNLCFYFMQNGTVKIISRESIIKGQAIDIDDYFTGDWSIEEKKEVALHFIHENDDNDLVFEERFQDVSDRQSDLRDTVSTFDDLIAVANPQDGDIRWVIDQNCYYEYRELTSTTVDPGTLKDYNSVEFGWQEFSIGFQNAWYEYGRDEVEEIKTSWSSLFGIWPFGNMAIQKGEMNNIRAASASFSPRLMVYNGNNMGGFKSNTLSLEYEEQNIGILPKYWKNWNRFWANRLSITGEFDFSVNALKTVINNIHQKHRTRDGEFIIEEMNCEIFIDRIGITEIKGYKVE